MSTKPHNKTVRLLLVGCLTMFAFAFLQIPLYGWFCEITGINGKIETENRGLSPADLANQGDAKRLSLRFFSSNAEKVNWDFVPEKNSIQVEAGKNYQTYFVARNNNNHSSKIQAVPSIAPAAAAKYLHKIECFCFSQQELKPHQKKKMGLSFAVSNNLPSEIKNITLTYSLFSLPNGSSSGDHKQMYTQTIKIDASYRL